MSTAESERCTVEKPITFCAVGLLCALALLLFSGCLYLGSLKSEKPPYDWQIYQPYNRTLLKVSRPSEVLAMINRPEYEILSQSESVVASWGQKREGYKSWFNMVAFDDNELRAKRKYVLVVDDRVGLLEQSKKDMSFDCQMVLERELLAEPLASDNARRIAVLQRVKENVLKDIEEVGSDNRLLRISGLMANQALEAVLVKLEQSPAFASRLDQPLGTEFSHPSLDRGRIQMFIDVDIVSVKVRLGSAAERFEKEQLELEEQYQTYGPAYF